MKSNQLSQSAAFIAVKLYGLTRDDRYRSLFNDNVLTYYERVVKALPAPIRYYHYWLKFSWIRSIYIRSEELFLPGDLMHILARKYYIQQMVEHLLSHGYEQILILGGGFDHSSLIYSQQYIPCLEADSPHMAGLKKQFLNKSYPDASHPKIVSMHLPQHTLSEVLDHQKRLSSQKKTIIIAEGFFDYMEENTVRILLSDIRDYFTSSTLISTHFALDELSAFHRFIFKSSLQLVGEKLQFNTSIDDFKHLLTNQQFEMDQCIGTQQIEKDFLPLTGSNLPVLNGFYLFTAHTDDSTIPQSVEH